MPIAEIAATGKHLAECARCAALARTMFAVEGPRQLSAAVANREDDAAPHRLRTFLLAAAAVLIAVIAAATFLLLRAPHRTTTPITHTVPPTTAPVPKRYERAEWTGLVRTALASGAVTIDAPAAEAPETLRGSEEAPGGTMTPSSTAVESERPEFSWPPVHEAQFVVTIAYGDEVVARSETLRANRWTPAQPLARGRTYAWQVRVLRDRIDTLPPPPREAPRFRVLTDDEVRDIDVARATHPDDHLLLGVLAAHYGLRDTARRELAAYAATNPSAAARRLAESAAAR